MKTLNTFEFRSFTHGGRYDWDTILDGKIHQLTQGEDYHTEKTSTFSSLARNQAKKRGGTVRTTAVEGGVVMQFVKEKAKRGKKGAAADNGDAE